MTHIRIYKELRKAIAGFLATMLLPLLTACEHKDLCYDHSHTTQLEVVFDWTEAPDANPATMSLYLYPEDGSEHKSQKDKGQKQRHEHVTNYSPDKNKNYENRTYRQASHGKEHRLRTGRP